MKIFSTFLSICLLLALPSAMAHTDPTDVPGPDTDYGQSSLALSEPTTDDVSVGLDNHHSNHYEWMNIQGFSVQVRLPREMDVDMQEHYTETLDLLNRQLVRAKSVLPELAVSRLQTSVYIFLKDDCTEDGSVSYYRYDDTPDQGWIFLHCFHYLSNVLDDAYHGGERVHGRRVWGHPGIIVHELAHGWHDLFVDSGYDNGMIEEFYDHAVDCLGNSDTTDPYYWESHETEFFADFTVMYFLSHWDPPRIAWQMQRKYRLLIVRLWNEDEYEDWEDQLDSCGN